MKKKEIMPFAAPWMDLEIIIVNEVSQKDKYDITYMWAIKYDTNELIYETEADSQAEIRTVIAKEKRRWGRDRPGVWD